MSFEKEHRPLNGVLRAVAPLLAVTVLGCSPSQESPRVVTPKAKTVVVQMPENMSLAPEVSVVIDPAQQAMYDAQTAAYDAQKYDAALQMNRKQEALEYINGAYRNEQFAVATNNFANVMARYAQNNKLGNFNFYNAQTKTWGRSAYNEGLGALSHVPGSGGYNGFFGVTGVYQNLDGTLDASKGVHDIFVSVPGQPWVAITLMDYRAADGTSENGWQVSVVENPSTDQAATIMTDRIQAQTRSAEELKAIDQRALSVLQDSLGSLPA